VAYNVSRRGKIPPPRGALNRPRHAVRKGRGRRTAPTERTRLRTAAEAESEWRGTPGGPERGSSPLCSPGSSRGSWWGASSSISSSRPSAPRP